MKKTDSLWQNEWSKEPFKPIVKIYKGVIVGSDEEPDASICMSSFSYAMGEYFGERMKILDYGCGSGRYCNFLSKRLQDFKYVGIERNISDYTKLCIDTAKRIFGEDERLSFGYTDSEFEQKAIDECNVVLLLSVFTHTSIEMTENIINRLMPIINRDGCIVFSMIHKNDYSLIGNAYGFTDEYSVTYNTYSQVEDLRKKFGVSITLMDTYDAKGIIHSIYRITKIPKIEIIETKEENLFDYVISFYFGQRRSPITNAITKSDKYVLVKKHIQFLEGNINLLNDIGKIVFVISDVNDTDLNNVKEIISKSIINDKILVFGKNNDNYSYGCWNDALLNRINGGSKYAFLCEDDYIPCNTDFHKYFIEYFTDDVAYVCQLYKNNHAAISNGFISYDKCRINYVKFNTIFKLSKNQKGYTSAQEDQVHFLDFFGDFKKLDITDKFISNFISLDKIVSYGNTNGIELIKPIM